MSYNEFFGFSDSPFLDVPDLKFLFLVKQHEALLAALTESITSHQGIAILSGDDGVGKTMLVQALMQKLPSSYQPIAIAQPVAEPLATTVMIAQSLAVTLREQNLLNLTPLVNALQDAARQGKFFLALFDDAHVLTDQHLEEVYFLSQMEYQGRQLMPIILVGRNGLVQKLDSSDTQGLRQLVHKNLNLVSLTLEETNHYIDHRLQQVGSSFAACFADGCLDQLFAHTGGIPRRINQECDKALNRAWQEHRTQVTRDLLGDEEPAPAYEPLTAPLEEGLQENNAEHAAVEEVSPEISEEPTSPPEPLTPPTEEGYADNSGAQIAHEEESQETDEEPTPLIDNTQKSIRFKGYHWGVIGVVLLALVISYLLILNKPPSFEQQVIPEPKAEKKPPVSQKTTVPPHSSPSQPLSSSLTIPGRENLLALLQQVREAQLKKDISLFLKVYSPNFPNLSEKKKDVLATWEKYDYLDLDFKLGNIQQKNAHTLIGKVAWDITLEDVQSKKKRKLVKDYTVRFSNSSGKWLIQSIQEED